MQDLHGCGHCQQNILVGSLLATWHETTQHATMLLTQSGPTLVSFPFASYPMCSCVFASSLLSLSLPDFPFVSSLLLFSFHSVLFLPHCFLFFLLCVIHGTCTHIYMRTRDICNKRMTSGGKAWVKRAGCLVWYGERLLRHDAAAVARERKVGKLR